MLEQRSALAAVYRIGHIGAAVESAPVRVVERLSKRLAQISGWPGSFPAVCQRLEASLDCPVPQDCRRAVTCNERSVFRVGPERVWLAGSARDTVLESIDADCFGSEAVVTEIAHSRTLVRVTGPQSGALLNRGLPVDLGEDVFGPASFAQSAIHHMPVLVHRLDTPGTLGFDIYVTREYAISFWQWLTEAAESFGCQVAEAER